MGDCNSRFYDEGSEMWYGDFISENYFRIEKEQHYDKVLKHNRVKAVDCVLYCHDEKHRHHNVIFIEGKKNLRYDGKGFRTKISDISMQFMDSLNIVCGSWLRTDNTELDLPNNFSQFFKKRGQILFTLIIKNCPISELLYIEQALTSCLKKERLLWRISVNVYNEELALKKKLVFAMNETEKPRG